MLANYNICECIPIPIVFHQFLYSLKVKKDARQYNQLTNKSDKYHSLSTKHGGKVSGICEKLAAVISMAPKPGHTTWSDLMEFHRSLENANQIIF